MRAVLAAGAAMALVVTACSSSSHGTAKSPSGSGSATTTASSAVSPAAGSSAGNTDGVTPTTIRIGQLADVSGPDPGLFAGAVNGLDAWAAMVNSQGGIAGHKIIVDTVDSALNCTTYTNGINRLASNSFALVGSFSLVDACGEKTLKANPDLLDIEGAVLNPALDPFPNVYAPTPAEPGAANTVYKWVKDKYGAAAVKKTGVLWGSPTQFDYAEQASAMRATGYDIIYNRGFSPLETNFTSDILRMKNAGVEVVDETDDAVQYVADFLKQAAQQNFHPLAVINGTAYDPTFFKLLGNPSYASNLVMYLPEAMYLGEDARSVPEINVVTKWLHKTHPSAHLDLFVIEAFTAGLLFQQAMEKLGSHPTRAGLASAIKNVTSFNANGLLAQENPGQRVPSYCEVIIRTRGTSYVRTDPPNNGFECDGTFVPFKGS